MKFSDRVHRKMLQIRCHGLYIKNKLKTSTDKGIVTIYHDYERHYHHPDIIPYSDTGVSEILAIERKYSVKSTFNIVAQLLGDVRPIIETIRDDGHEIASHSYSHQLFWSYSRNDIEKDIALTKRVFQQNALSLKGLRCPQSKWRFGQLPIMLAHGLQWSAENDTAQWPYVICRHNNRRIVRLPIRMDDWAYEEASASPNAMFKRFSACVENIARNKAYGAIGFHPWVQGKNVERLKVFDNLLEYIMSRDDILVLPFSQALEHLNDAHDMIDDGNKR